MTTLSPDPDRPRETLDRLAQRLGASLSDALGRSAGEGLDDVLGQIGRTLAGGALKRALKPVTLFAQGGVAAPSYFPLGRGLGLMGEQDQEAGLPLARGPDGRRGVRAGGGASARPVNVTVNVMAADADGVRRSEAQVAAALARAVARGQRGL